MNFVNLRLTVKEESGESESDFMDDDKPKKSGRARIESDSSAAEPEILAVESDSDKAADRGDKDEFDISDSDDCGSSLAKKVAPAGKGKKPPPKKLTKSSDLFTDMMAGGGGAKKPPGPAKKLPVPKKATEASKKHKKSESQSENDKPAKKRVKKAVSVLDSDSDGDMFASSQPSVARSKPGTSSYLFLILSCWS